MDRIVGQTKKLMVNPTFSRAHIRNPINSIYNIFIHISFFFPPLVPFLSLEQRHMQDHPLNWYFFFFFLVIHMNNISMAKKNEIYTFGRVWWLLLAKSDQSMHDSSGDDGRIDPCWMKILKSSFVRSESRIIIHSFITNEGHYRFHKLPINVPFWFHLCIHIRNQQQLLLPLLLLLLAQRDRHIN